MSNPIQFRGSPITPLHFCSAYSVAQTSLEWVPVVKLANSCTGKITTHGDHLGCGVLVGIDRFLAPSHCVSEETPSQLTVSFYAQDAE